MRKLERLGWVLMVLSLVVTLFYTYKWGLEMQKASHTWQATCRILLRTLDIEREFNRTQRKHK